MIFPRTQITGGGTEDRRFSCTGNTQPKKSSQFVPPVGVPQALSGSPVLASRPSLIGTLSRPQLGRAGASQSVKSGLVASDFRKQVQSHRRGGWDWPGWECSWPQGQR